MSTPPDERWRHLIEHIQDAVVDFEIVAGEPVVRYVNESFVELFGYESTEVRGRSLNACIVPEWLADEARDLDARTTAGEINYRRVRRMTAGGLREFLYRGIPYEGEDGASRGFAVYTDLTERSRQELRLQVLNRVLRHNLRNNANIVAGHTRRLLEDDPDRPADVVPVLSAIDRAATELESLVEEATQIQCVLDEAVEDGVVDCVPLARRVATQYRERYPDAAVELDVPETLTVRASDRLRYAVGSLVDNAIRHNPSERPHVRIQTEESDSGRWRDICVDDDGPEIPAVERAVITGESEITQIQHGSGLGLWLAKWTTERFGGRLSFEESEFGGNRVRLRLPNG